MPLSLSLSLSLSLMSLLEDNLYILYSIQEKAVNISYSVNDMHNHYSMDAYIQPSIAMFTSHVHHTKLQDQDMS